MTLTIVDSIVPPRFRDRRLLTYIPKTTSEGKALAAAQAFAEGAIRSLVLVGPPGVGKTHLAAGILAEVAIPADELWHEAMEEADHASRIPSPPARPTWTNVADLIVRLRLEMDRPLDDRRASDTTLRLRTSRGLAVLDDLGREKTSDWTSELIYTLVNARYEALLPTIVTSNLTAAELVTSGYWPAISRLAEDGELIEITGPDYRVSNAP